MRKPISRKLVALKFDNLFLIRIPSTMNIESKEKNKYGMSEMIWSFNIKKKGLNAKNDTNSNANVLSNFPTNITKTTISDNAKKHISTIFIANKFRPNMA